MNHFIRSEQRKISKVDVHTMILVTAATQFELQPLQEMNQNASEQLDYLVTGVGPAETAFQLTACLAKMVELPELVINFGIAGAYFQKNQCDQPALLDVCLASSEVFGDLGVAMVDSILTFDESLGVQQGFELDDKLVAENRQILMDRDIRTFTGTFITVNSTSGTKERGRALQAQFGGLCENMEGASVVRCCHYFGIPVMEIRTISNMVEDRNSGAWKLKEAAMAAASAVHILLEGKLR